MTQYDVNLNQAKCLRDSAFAGYTRVTNVCTGQVTDVPWGTMDIVGVALIISIGVLFVAMAAAICWRMWTNF